MMTWRALSISPYKVAAGMREFEEWRREITVRMAALEGARAAT
jgi:hypothetical protein